MEFLETQFFKDLTKLIPEAMNLQEDEDGNIKGTQYEELSIKDRYISGVFQYSMKINYVFEQLNIIPIFLNKFPLKRYYQKNEINYPIYIEYHMNIFYIKTTTILDLMAIVINEVYDLGIPRKKCTVQVISENKHTKRSSSVKVMKDFEKAILGIKTVRNKLSHQGKFDDPEIDDISLYHFVSQQTTNDKFKGKEFIKFLESNTKKLAKKKVNDVKNNNKVIEKFLILFFSSLEEEFTNKIIQLEKSNNT